MDPTTFFSGAGGEVDECSLLLRFFGDNLDPDAVSAMLGVDSTESFRKGDLVKEGESARRATGAWLLDCEKTTDTVDGQVMLLFGDLTDDLGIWESLAESYVAEIKCHLFLRRWNRATILSQSTIEAVGARHLRLHFDIYTPHQLWRSLSSEGKLPQ